MIRIITDNLLYMGISAAVFSLLLLVFTWISRRRLNSRLYLAGWVTALAMLVIPAYAIASLAGFSFSGVFGAGTSNSQAARYRAAYSEYMEKSVFPAAKDETKETISDAALETLMKEGTAAVTGNLNKADASRAADAGAVNADGIAADSGANTADKSTQQDLDTSTFKIDLSPEKAMTNAVSTPSANRVSLRDVIFAVWIFGVIVIGALKFLRYFRFRKMILTNSVPGDAEWMNLLPEKIRGNLKVREANVPSPVVFGIFHPTVVIPKRGLSDASMRYALMHEGLHILRKDLLLRTVAEAAAVLNWINPFAWLIRNKVTQYFENSCDEEVVTDLSAEERQKYAMSILDFMDSSDDSDPAYPATLMSFTGEAENVKRRLKHIMEFKTMRKRAMFLSCCVVAAAALIGVLAACSLAFPGSTDTTDESGIKTATESSGTAETTVLPTDSSDVSPTPALTPTPAVVDMSVFAIAPTYVYASEFSAAGYAIVQNGTGPNASYSFIDMEGNEVPQVYFDSFLETDSYYWKDYGDFCANGYLWIKKNNLWGFVNRECEVVVEPQYDDAKQFSADGIAGFKMNGKWGFLDETGKIVIKPQFEDVDIFRENGLCIFKENGKNGLIDESGRVVADPAYDAIVFKGETYDSRGPFDDNGSGVEAVVIDGKWGLIRSDGTVLSKPVYDNFFTFGSNGLAAVQKDGKYGYINTEGKLVIDCQFDDANYIFSDDGTAYVGENGKYGFINAQGEYIIEPQYDDAKPFAENGLAAVSVDGKWGFIDATGQYVVAPQYEYTYGFYDYSLTAVCKDGLWGLIDENGRYVLEPIYQALYASSVPDAYYASMPKGLTGMINSAGETLIPQEYTFIIMPDFYSDEGCYLINRMPINAALVHKGEKSGIVSLDGKILVPAIAEQESLSISPTGMVCVEYNGKYGYIQITE